MYGVLHSHYSSEFCVKKTVTKLQASTGGASNTQTASVAYLKKNRSDFCNF